MIREAISKVVDRQDLSEADMVLVMNEIMSGQTSPTQNAAFLAALRPCFTGEMATTGSRPPWGPRPMGAMAMTG